MDWKTGKPEGEVILAKLVPSWFPRYDVLHYDKKLNQYYDCCGEPTPDSAIEKYVPITD